jgi:hypothetical protein
MSKSLTIKAATLVASVALLGGTALLASGATGAYFSDSKPGTISGTIGNVHVSTNGGFGANGSDLVFTNLLPGEPQTVSMNYTNTGSGAEDIYIVFPNATALSALNNLGHYGQIHLSANGTALFDSDNIKDGLPANCLPFHPDNDGCWPLQSQYKLVSSLPAGATGSVTFSFNYAGKLSAQAPAGAPAPAWNSYPVAGQTTSNGADGTGSGLPYKIVATQHGITPGQ